MIEIRTTEDIYTALREVIEELTKAGLLKYAAILNHRMTKVAWTSRDELFEELLKVLSDLEATQGPTMTTFLADQIRCLVKKLREVGGKAEGTKFDI